MDIAAIWAALKAAILTKLASVGAALAAGLVTIGNGFTNDERIILSNCLQKWHDTYDVSALTGIDRIEQATTAALNEFASDEKAEMSQECKALLTLLDSAFKSALEA